MKLKYLKKRLAREFYKVTGYTPAGAFLGSLTLIGALVVFLNIVSAFLRLFGVG